MRKKIFGSPERPRLVVSQSAKHISAQVIDDVAGRTLVSASTMEADLRSADGDKTDKAKVGELTSPSGPRPPGSRTSSSTAPGTSTTVASRRWPTAPATPAWNSDDDERGRSDRVEPSAAVAAPAVNVGP